MPPAEELVTVALVTYNSARLLPDFVAGLAAGFGSVPYRLVVADNDSADDTLEVLARLAPEATVVRMGRNAGYAAGINAAEAAGPRGTAIFVLNPDVRLQPGCVPVLLDALRSSGAGIVAPMLLDGPGRLHLSLRREPTLLTAVLDTVIGAGRASRTRFGEIVGDPAAYTAAHDADWVEGSTQLIDRACWEACGGWDESYFLYSEEIDYDLRVRDSGRSVRFVPEAVATHLKGDSGTSPALWALLTLNRVRFFRRRHGRLQAVAFWLLMVLREGSRAALGQPKSRRALRALLDRRNLSRSAFAAYSAVANPRA